MRTASIALLIVSAVGVCYADVIELKNGQKLSGSIRALEQGKLLVVVGGQSQELRMTTVKSFSIGDAAGAGNAVQPGGQPAAGERLSLADCEPGKEGFITATFTVESAEEDRFIGSYKIVAEGLVRGERAAVFQGVDTDSLVTGKFVRLEQRMKCVGTENLAGGQRVYVFEPVDASQRQVSKAENPALSQPVPGGVRVRDIRGR